MKDALLALSLLTITTLATRAEAQTYPNFDGVVPVVVGGAVVISVPVTLTATSMVLDGIILTGLANGEQVKRSVLITNLVFSVISAAMNAGLVVSSLALTRGEFTAWTGIAIGAMAFNAGSAILSGVVLKSRPPVTLTPMVVDGGGGASLSLRW